MPTALIADDEDLPRLDLARMLTQLWPELRVLRECGDGVAAAEAIDELAPDIAFLDIRMPEMSGLDVARAVSGRCHCHCVFTTAFDAHAIAAFEAGAVDYLLKPVQQTRLEATLERLRQRLQQRSPQVTLDALVTALAQQQSQKAKPPLRWLSASVGNNIKLCSIDEVIYFQSDERYTRVVTPTESLHVGLSMGEIIAGLEPEEFWQLHRGLVVRATAIAHAKRDDLGRITVTLKNDAGSFTRYFSTTEPSTSIE